MSNQERIDAAAVKMTKEFRSVGWWFLVVGSIVCIDPVAALFDPQATITVNGVPTADLSTKLGWAAFALMFPLLGSFLVLTPRKKLKAGLVVFSRWPKAFTAWPPR